MDTPIGLLAFLKVDVSGPGVTSRGWILARAWFPNEEALQEEHERLFGLPFHNLKFEDVEPFSKDIWFQGATLWDIRENVRQDDPFVDVVVRPGELPAWKRRTLAPRLSLRRPLEHWLKNP